MAKTEMDGTGLSFIGCGVMAESMIAGLLREEIVRADQVVGSHPRAERRAELKDKYGIRMFDANAEAAAHFSGPNAAVVLTVKPQRSSHVLEELAEAVGQENLVISIVAGTSIETISDALKNKFVVRAMPNTPSQIGKGMTAWTCSGSVDEKHKRLAKVLFTALGKELFVETENMIDMATSLSATGPTYTFMVMEAMTDAGVHLGFSREVSQRACSANDARVRPFRDGISQTPGRTPQHGHVARRDLGGSYLPDGKGSPENGAFESHLRGV